MSRSLATTAGERGLAPSKARSPSTDQILAKLHGDLLAHPCSTCLNDAHLWLCSLQAQAATGAALAFSPTLSLRARQIELSSARRPLRRMIDLVGTLYRLPDRALDLLTAGALAGRRWLDILITDAFALGATLDRAAAELRALRRQKPAALTPPAPAKRRVLPETT